MTRAVKCSAWVVAVIITTVTRLATLASAADSITLIPGATEYLPGQRLDYRGFSLSRSGPVDVYLGIALPGNAGIAFFDPKANITIVPGLGATDQIPKYGSFPASPPGGLPGVYFPTTGLEDGTYNLRFFIASVAADALLDGVLAAGDLLAADVRPITLTYSKEPRFEFEPIVSSGQRTLIEQTVLEVRTFLEHLGTPDLGAVTILVAETLEGVGQAYSKWLHISPQEAMQQKAAITGEAGFGFVFMRAPTGRTTVYHELFHVLQGRLVGTSFAVPETAVSLAGPVWLIEGGAIYFTDLAADHFDLYDFSVSRNAHLQSARAASAPLTNTETRAGFRAVGNNLAGLLGFAAVDFLLGSGPMNPLIEFWRRIGAGISWPEAFAQVFGRSISTFYQQFEAYRAAAFPPQ